MDKGAFLEPGEITTLVMLFEMQLATRTAVLKR
jgi:hypothetical protein